MVENCKAETEFTGFGLSWAMTNVQWEYRSGILGCISGDNFSRFYALSFRREDRNAKEVALHMGRYCFVVGRIVHSGRRANHA
jgi:hypothetical protein